MKALGLLAFRPELLKRFIRDALQLPVDEQDDVTILFFTRIGEGFFREAVERVRHSDDERRDLEARLNVQLGLPDGFRWRTNADGRLTQVAKWSKDHITSMLAANRRVGDEDLRRKLAWIQDCFNTEPDLVLHWAGHLAVVEIKVLSGEGTDQLPRQLDLGRFLAAGLGESSHFFIIGPDGTRPSSTDCTFIAWSRIATCFDDVPAMSEYIRDFAFFYNGRWRSMVSSHADKPGETAYDVFMKNRPTHSAFDRRPLAQTAGATASLPQPSSLRDPNHFSHLGPHYFDFVYDLRASGHWPLKTIWLGVGGVAYVEKSNGRKINPNWMAESDAGRMRTRHGGAAYTKNIRAWPYSEIAAKFGLPT